MKVEVTSTPPPRKLVAVVGNGGSKGIFFREVRGGVEYSIYVDGNGYLLRERHTLEEVAKVLDRTPVYEGDTLTITF